VGDPAPARTTAASEGDCLSWVPALRQWKTTRARQSPLTVLLILIVVLAIGCGQEGDKQSGNDQARTKQAAVAMLRSWEAPLTRAIEILDERNEAIRTGDHKRVAQLDRQAATAVRPIDGFGGDARRKLLGREPVRLTNAVVASGDAWSDWAHTLLTETPQNDPRQGQRISRLGVAAGNKYIDAYRIAGAEPPPSFRATSN
jgi:hypothetical protein